ncbi:hypothetical protein [Parafrankia discariae]|uniref:hypothetical protein n=1 Tax=Parafrankia discariae TaxID=365528 RepID=UPI00036D3F53|nr:hypothetical protein [Parafrankia discariae]
MTSPPPVVTPTTDLVAVAWLRGVPGLPADRIATKVPADVSVWAGTGFVQVTAVGGEPDIDVPMRRPVVSVDLWAVNPTSGRPPWGKAASLAEHARMGCYGNVGRVVALPAVGLAARVLSVYPMAEPRRVPDDEGSYARYQFDLALHWTHL